MLALVARVDEAVLALVVQLHQHAHGAPLTSPQRTELPVLVSGQRQKGITPIHEVTGQQRVRVHYGWEGVDDRPRVEVDNKEDLEGKPLHQHLITTYYS